MQPQAKLRPRPKRIVVHQNQNSSKPSCLSFLSQCEEVLHAASQGSLSLSLSPKALPERTSSDLRFQAKRLERELEGEDQCVGQDNEHDLASCRTASL